VILSTEFVNNPVHTGAWRRQSRCGGKGLHQHAQRLTSREEAAVGPALGLAGAQRERAGSIVAVTRLRPEFLLR